MAKLIRRQNTRAARMARGERNNNPLNLIWLPPDRAWDGQLPDKSPDEGRFGRYETPEAGIRAGVLQIKTHIARGHDTPTKLIAVWAPPSENKTQAYIAAVCDELGIAPDATLAADDGELMFDLARAMARYECGYIPWGDATWKRGVSMAGYWPGRRPTLTQSRTVAAAGVGGGASVAAIVTSALQDHTEAVISGAQAILAGPNTIIMICAAVTLICAGYTAWARYTDWRDGYR